MGRNSTRIFTAGDLEEDFDPGPVLNVRSSVSPDGREVSLRIDKEQQSPVSMSLSFGEACLIYHEMRTSLQLARGRNKMTLDLAQGAIDELLRTALRPAAIGFEVDASGDTFIVYIFEDHAPFAVKLSSAQLFEAEAQLRSLTRRRAN